MLSIVTVLASEEGRGRLAQHVLFEGIAMGRDDI